MFLNQLTAKEKEAFISLSMHVANANGVIEESERLMMLEYCKEMDIPHEDADNNMSVDEIVAVFSKSDIKNKKIMMFEILGLVYSDGVYDQAEKNFIKGYAEKVGISQEVVNKQTELIVKYLDLLKQIAETIN